MEFVVSTEFYFWYLYVLIFKNSLWHLKGSFFHGCDNWALTGHCSVGTHWQHWFQTNDWAPCSMVPDHLIMAAKYVDNIPLIWLLLPDWQMTGQAAVTIKNSWKYIELKKKNFKCKLCIYKTCFPFVSIYKA